MLHRLKKLIPQPLLQVYHLVLARAAAILYRHPSDKLIVIGVTGTNGKSSTTQFIAKLLTEMGHRVGYTSTAGFNIAGKEIENAMKMTMPGRFLLQKLIAQMVQAGCKYAVIETSSQGIAQFRHLGINYDVSVFTNLTPEHIEAHGSFEAYKQAKGKLFSHMVSSPRKTIDGQQIHKTSVVFADDEHGEYYASFKADRVLTFSWKGENSSNRIVAKYLERNKKGVELDVNGEHVFLSLLADFQHRNALAAISAVHGAGITLPRVVSAAAGLTSLPGRFESIDKGQPFHVIVDYAYEPYAITALIESVKGQLKPKRIIGVHGSAGGGRDVARRYQIGRLAAQEESIVIVTNEDPYDEDPRSIIEAVAAGARDAGKVEGEDLFLIDARMEAIEKAVALAQEGDVVILTGKGSEPVMAVADGKKIPWSDRQAALQALAKQGHV